jgi:uncharacterized protein (DUF1330 family)
VAALFLLRELVSWLLATLVPSIVPHPSSLGYHHHYCWFGGGRCRNPTEETVAKAYWVVCYRSISDPAAREAYSKLGDLAVLAAGGRILAGGMPAKTYERGIKERTVLIEFDSLARAIAAHDSPDYKAALAVLGNGADRDLRIVEGVDD